jgi:hypothetical protein
MAESLRHGGITPSKSPLMYPQRKAIVMFIFPEKATVTFSRGTLKSRADRATAMSTRPVPMRIPFRISAC